MSDDFFYRLFFKIKLYESNGESFQKLFSEIMFYRNEQFQSVSPYGNWGDGGNDGFIPSENHYFQIYAPKATTTLSPKIAIDKAIEDFAKLKNIWKNLERYTFVINDKFEGVPAPVLHALENLKYNEKLLDVQCIDSQKLTSEFMKLSEEQKQTIVGFIPGKTPEIIDDRAVGELLRNLVKLVDNSKNNIELFGVGEAPDFSKKIKFNSLNSKIASRLIQNSYQISIIDEYLDSIDPSYKQSIAEEIHDMYKFYKTSIPDNEIDYPGVVYFSLVEKLIPEYVKNLDYGYAAYRTAAELILAKYFETCDVYEDPNNDIT